MVLFLHDAHLQSLAAIDLIGNHDYVETLDNPRWGSLETLPK